MGLVSVPQHPRGTSGVPNSWDTAVANVGVLAAGYPVPETPLRLGTWRGEDAPAAASRSSPWQQGGFGPSLPLLWDRERSPGHREASS